LLPRLPSNGSTLKFVALRSWALTKEAGNVVTANARKPTNNFNEPKRTITNSILQTSITRPISYSETK
jgi:hypothetical protein